MSLSEDTRKELGLSLEDAVEEWLTERVGTVTNADMQDVSRFLQLARREGYAVCMKRNEGTLRLATTSDAEWEVYENTIPRRQFPIRRRVTKPNVLMGPFSQWRMGADGRLEHRDSDRDPHGWRPAMDLPNTPRMAAIVAELVARPTITREIEE